MRKKIMKKTITIAAALLIIQAPLAAIAPVSKTHAAANTNVYLDTRSTLSIRDAHLLMQEKGLVLAFTTTITNNNVKELNLLDYMVRVKAKNGKTFKAVMTEKDKDVKTVAANTSINITYTAVVDTQTKISDLTFEVVKWDFSVAGYERKLGNLHYATTGNERVKPFQPKVMLYNDTKIKGALKQYIVTKDEKNAYITLNYLLENYGFSSAKMSEMNFALQTDSYSVFDIQVPGMSDIVLQPRQRNIVTMNATVPLAVLGKSVTLVAFSKDGASNVSIPLGAFEVPKLMASPATAVNSTKNIFLGGQSLQTKVQNALASTTGTNTELYLDYFIRNVGNVSIPATKLEFTIKTQNNINYDLKTSEDFSGDYAPSIDQTIILSGTLPSSIDLSTAELIVKTAATETAPSAVIGVYKIGVNSASSSIGTTFSYATDYEVKLVSIQRSPLEDSDALVADIQVTNKGKTTGAIPALGGYFMANGVKINAATNKVVLDQLINLAPGGTYSYVVYTKIPYNTELSNVSFIVTDDKDDKNIKSLYRFSARDVSKVQEFKEDQVYPISNVGNKSSVRLLRSNIFKMDKDQYYYGEFEAINLEARSAQMVNLGGYVMDSLGQLIPITFAKVNKRVLSNGKVLISASGKLGQGFNADDYQVIVGQAISVKDEGTEAVNTVVVKPVSYKISKNSEQFVKKDFKDLKISDYKLSFKNVYAVVNSSGGFIVDGIKLLLDYDLLYNGQYDYVAGEHKLMFELIDQDLAKATYTAEYSIAEGKEGELVLKTGTTQPLSVVFNDPQLTEKIQSYKTYKLNIYDLYEDTKVLIATKELNWFERTP